MIYPVYYALASIAAVLLSLHRTIHIPDYFHKNILLIGPGPGNDDALNAVIPSTVSNGAASKTHIPELVVLTSRALVPVPTCDQLGSVSDNLSAPEAHPTRQFDYASQVGTSQGFPGIHEVHNQPPLSSVPIAFLVIILLVVVFLWTWIGSPLRIFKRYIEQADTEMRDFLTEVQQRKGRLLDRLDVLHLLVDEQSHDVLHRLRMGDYGQPTVFSDYLDRDLSSLAEQACAEFDLQLSLWHRLGPDLDMEDDDTSSVDLRPETPDLSVMVQPLSIVKVSESEEDDLGGMEADFPARVDLGPPFL